MADNYLERRMDDYRSGRLAPKSKGAASMPKDVLVMRYPKMSVFVFAMTDTTFLRTLLSTLSSAGIATGLHGVGDREGSGIAQRCGVRFYPLSFSPESALSDFAERKGAPAHVVSLMGEDVPHTLRIREDLPEAVANLVVFMMHPSQSELLPIVAKSVFSADNSPKTIKNS